MYIEEWQKEIIEKKVAEIKNKMIGGAIYGIPILEDSDPDLMILAAYYVGRVEEALLYSAERFDWNSS